jgi:hypothetical protein
MLSLRTQQQAQSRFDHFGHRAALTHGLTLQLGHDGIIDVERRLHMHSHITDMAIWQTGHRHATSNLPVVTFAHWQRRPQGHLLFGVQIPVAHVVGQADNLFVDSMNFENRV